MAVKDFGRRGLTKGRLGYLLMIGAIELVDVVEQVWRADGLRGT